MRRGSQLPSFQNTVSLFEQYNRPDCAVTIVFFWSISCQQCTRTFDVIRQFSERHEDVNIIAVHMPLNDNDKDVAAIKQKYKQKGLRAPLHVDQELMVSQRFANRFVPSIYVFDASGLRYYQAGPANMRTVVQRIEKILP